MLRVPEACRQLANKKAITLSDGGGGPGRKGSIDTCDRTQDYEFWEIRDCLHCLHWLNKGPQADTEMYIPKKIRA